MQALIDVFGEWGLVILAAAAVGSFWGFAAGMISAHRTEKKCQEIYERWNQNATQE